MDITEIKAGDGKRYVSAVFDCFDFSAAGLATDTICQWRSSRKKNALPDIIQNPKIRLSKPPQVWYNVHESNEQCKKGKVRSCAVLAHKQTLTLPFL